MGLENEPAPSEVSEQFHDPPLHRQTKAGLILWLRESDPLFLYAFLSHFYAGMVFTNLMKYTIWNAQTNPSTTQPPTSPSRGGMGTSCQQVAKIAILTTSFTNCLLMQLSCCLRNNGNPRIKIPGLSQKKHLKFSKNSVKVWLRRVALLRKSSCRSAALFLLEVGNRQKTWKN